MKAQYHTIQFSGYPLRVVEMKPAHSKAELFIVPPAQNFQTSLQKNEITNNPNNWDERWFTNYE